MANRHASSGQRSGRDRFRRAGVLLTGLVCAGLLAAPISPAWADSTVAEKATFPVVGGFGVGDGIEAMVDERDGALTFALPVGGLDLTWDSRAGSAGGRFGLGAGWGLGLGVVQAAGGVQFSPASGGRYELDTSHPSGLHGYGARDVAFRVVDDGRVPARADGAVAERGYRYRLHELGGLVTSFDELGDPIRGADGATYAYDAANRPVSRTRGGQTVQTSYWGDGARRSRARVDETGAAGAQTTYFWDGATLVNEVHTEPGAEGVAGGGVASYLLGATRHARTTIDDAGRRTAYLGTDRHGNVTDLTDEHGGVAIRYGYSDYGVQTIESEDTEPVTGLARNPFGYAGEQADDDGSLYLRARVYDPVTMRFTSEDEAERLDRYNYADLNPIMMVDPTGRTPQWDEIVDLVTGGLALVSLTGSAIMAAFTGGLSLTGLGIMGVASDLVTMLAVTARAVDRELPELEILDHDGEHMLLGVELAFGAFGVVGAGVDLRQLDVSEALFAVERDADRVLNASREMAAVLEPSKGMRVLEPSRRIRFEHFGAPTRTHKYNIDAETRVGDRQVAALDAHLVSTRARVDAIRTFNGAHRTSLEHTTFLLRGYGTQRILGKIDTILENGGGVESLAAAIQVRKVDWAEVQYEVEWARAQHYTVPGQAPKPPPLPQALPERSTRHGWGYESDEDLSRTRIGDDAFS